MFEHYPKFDKLPFNPERAEVAPGLDVERLLNEFKNAYADLMVQEARKQAGQGHQTAEIGQITGKIWLRLVEGIDKASQPQIIAELRKIMGNENQYVCGFMGEFATGTLLKQADLKIYYPPALLDLREGGDLVIKLPDSKIGVVQSKTLSLSENFRRVTESGRPLNLMPVFYDLESDEDMDQFKENMQHLEEEHLEDSHVADRIVKIRQECIKMHDRITEMDRVPIVSLLLKPGKMPDMEACDINPKTARVFSFTEKIARQDLEAIKNRHKP